MTRMSPKRRANRSAPAVNDDGPPDTLARLRARCAAMAACARAIRGDRQLDAMIAMAVFPGLAELRELGGGVWQHPDGSRVRALRYSSSATAARTLVPPGHWIETTGSGVIIAGAEGAWSGRHPIEAIAICLAALRARDAASECEVFAETSFQENIHG